MRSLLVIIPYIENLNFKGSVVSDTFLQPDPPSHTKLLPPLRYLRLDGFTLQNRDCWSPLISYTRYQTSGGQWGLSPRSSGGGEGDRGFS